MCMTAQHIRDVLAGTSLTQCLASTPAAIHAAVLAHDFYALRQLGWAQEVGKLLVPKKPKKALLYAHLLHSLILLEAAHRWGRSEERRVGKECRCGRSAGQEKER